MGFILDSSDSPGHLKDYGGSLMANHLLCDGTNYLVATYPNLFARIGHTFGGSGANFNVPDSRRRVLMGSGGTQISGPANTVGSVGGEETHTLSISEMPSHSHLPPNASSSGTDGYALNQSTNDVAIGTVTHSGSFGTDTQGNSSAHNNVQPSLVVTKQIRY